MSSDTSIEIENIGRDTFKFGKTRVVFSDEWVKVEVGDEIRLLTDSASLFLGFMNNYMAEMFNRHLAGKKCLEVVPYPTKPEIPKDTGEAE